MELNRIAFMHCQSEFQSSNTERLYYFCQENAQFFAHEFVPQRQWREIQVLTFLHKVNQSMELLAVQPRECLVCDSCVASV